MDHFKPVIEQGSISFEIYPIPSFSLISSSRTSPLNLYKIYHNV